MNGRTAIVTGGATGIGLATVRRLLVTGCRVVVASRDEDRGRELVSTLDTKDIAFVRTDVTDESAVVSMIDATIDRFGRLDYLFNNAGIEGTVGPMAAWPADHVDDVLAVNVKGPFLCMKHAALVMTPGSVIVNASSLLGTIPMPVAAPYAASKAALLSLNRSAAAELQEHGVSVFAICPAIVDTPMMDRVSAASGAPKEALAQMVCPSGLVTPPDRVAEVVVGLFTGEIDVESGAALRIDPNSVEQITSSLGAPEVGRTVEGARLS